MATEDRDRPAPEPLLDRFLQEKDILSGLLAEQLTRYFEQEEKPEIELVRVYLGSFQRSLESAGAEIKKQYAAADTETQFRVENHLRSSSAIDLLSRTNAMVRERGGVLGFLEKLVPILEIVKKILVQIIEFFPNFIEKILKKIVLPLLEIVENLIKHILALFSSPNAADLLRAAETDFLTTHPLWRRMQFDTVAPSTAV